jgi:hypothetical protein
VFGGGIVVYRGYLIICMDKASTLCMDKAFYHPGTHRLR